jgi:hypothetical protein
MREARGRRLAGWAGAMAFFAAVTVSAGIAMAQPTFTSGSWGTADGGAVEVSDNGAYNMAFTDETTKTNIFSTGKLISKKPTSDGKLELILKPTAPTAAADTWVIDIDSSGNGELFAVKGGERHKAATLTK